MKRLAALLALLPLPALAHHPMGGATPATLWQGLASGVGHPVIGPDHLAFLIAAGVLAAALPLGSGVFAIAAFVLGGFAGSLLHVAGIGLGPVETAVALSVLAAGVALAGDGCCPWSSGSPACSTATPSPRPSSAPSRVCSSPTSRRWR